MLVPQLMLFSLFNLIIPSICPSYPDDIPKNAFDFGLGSRGLSRKFDIFRVTSEDVAGRQGGA